MAVFRLPRKIIHSLNSLLAAHAPAAVHPMPQSVFPEKHLNPHNPKTSLWKREFWNFFSKHHTCQQKHSTRFTWEYAVNPPELLA
ncbi:hypothetical protein [Acetobacter lambici]|uniref:hypothetical protein n=1 Tax=Acetobacter lambici TaxID=1332824 RepID=UPI0020A259FF|nr:hypothetical protein [Acetobacter lambici]MCP1241972.1 hypothetical protein [Acetobacter lambici]